MRKEEGVEKDLGGLVGVWSRENIMSETIGRRLEFTSFRLHEEQTLLSRTSMGAIKPK